MKKKTLGVILIVLGLILSFDKLGYINISNTIEMYWPMVLIIVGLVGLLEDRFFSLLNVFLIMIGSFFQLDKFDIFYFNIWTLFLPTVFILVGIKLISNNSNRYDKYDYEEELYENEYGTDHDIIDEEDYDKKKDQEKREFREEKAKEKSSEGNSYVNDISYDDFVNTSSVLTEISLKNKSSAFKGGRISSIVGGFILDLSEAEFLEGKAFLDFTCVMGNIKILIADDCRVEIEGRPILGSWKNKKEVNKENEKKLLKIRATIVLGGLEIE